MGVVDCFRRLLRCPVSGCDRRIDVGSVSPDPAGPVQNRDLMAAYRRAAGRGFGIGAPAFVTTIVAWILGSDPGLALTDAGVYQLGFSTMATNSRLPRSTKPSRSRSMVRRSHQPTP